MMISLVDRVSWRPLLINSAKFAPRFKQNVYIKVNIFRLEADPLRAAASRCRASCSGLLRGWAPFEEWFDGHINFHVTLFLEGITAKRLSVITARNVLSYWTASPGRHTAPHRTKKRQRSRKLTFLLHCCAHRLRYVFITTHAHQKSAVIALHFVFYRLRLTIGGIAFNIIGGKKITVEILTQKMINPYLFRHFCLELYFFRHSLSSIAWRFEVEATTFLAGPPAIHSSQQVWRACWV